MSQLEKHLKIRTPLVWVESDEPRRVLAETIATSDRQVFRMDAMEGLVTWCVDENRWRRVLVDVGGDTQPTFEIGMALMHTLEKRGVYVMENAHLQAETLLNFFAHVARVYSDAFFADNADAIPATFVLVSCTDKVPPEVARDVVRLRFELPTEGELMAVVTDVNDIVQVLPDEVTPAMVARAGVGMSEFEFVHSLARSLEQFKLIDPSYVNHLKVDQLKRNGLLEIRVPTMGLSDIGGLDRGKELMARAAWLWNHPEDVDRFGVAVPRRVLLVGVQGAGKSAICEAGADALGLDLAKFGTSQMMSKWVGESEANMRKAFAQVHAMAPLMLWIDEFGRDMSGGQSSGSVDAGTTDRVHGEFLQGLQELPDNVFLMCAANRIDQIPPEMTRKDRFDKILFVGFPTEAERMEIFKIHLAQAANDHDLEQLAMNTPRFTGAEIKSLIREVTFQVVCDEQRRPTTAEFVAHAPQMKGRIWNNHRQAVVEMYRRAAEEWEWASSGQEAEAQEILGQATPAQTRPVEQAHKVDSGNIFGDAMRRR